MAESGTWYYVHQGQSVGPATIQQIETLVRSGTITRDTLVWPGVGEWVPAASTGLASLFSPAAAMVANSASRRPSALSTLTSARAGFLKDKPRLRLALQIAVAILGLYAIYNGIGQMRDGMGELQGAAQPVSRTNAPRMSYQCRGVAWDTVQCAYENVGESAAKVCMDVVVICDDGRHVASVCSETTKPGEAATRRVDNFSPAFQPTSTCSGLQYENVKTQD